jgi:hypothetical protein
MNEKLLEQYMQIAHDTKKTFEYNKFEGVWTWRDRDDNTISGSYPTFWAALCDAVSPYVSNVPEKS